MQIIYSGPEWLFAGCFASPVPYKSDSAQKYQWNGCQVQNTRIKTMCAALAEAGRCLGTYRTTLGQRMSCGAKD